MSDGQINGVVFCLTCHNKGTVGGCPMCLKRRSRDSVRFERYRRENEKAAARPVEIRRQEIKDRQVALKEHEKELDEARREKDRMDYLYSTWEKLRDFNMDSTGDPSFDKRLIEMFGNYKYAPSETHHHVESPAKGTSSTPASE